MRIKAGFRQTVISVAVFAVVLLALVSFDPRVRERANDLAYGSTNGLTPWGDRAGDLGGALASAVRYQSIENAPLLVFATVGAVLFVFMVRT